MSHDTTESPKKPEISTSQNQVIPINQHSTTKKWLLQSTNNINKIIFTKKLI
jgi:Sec7-like guanine-nucleotide exchange factor